MHHNIQYCHFASSSGFEHPHHQTRLHQPVANQRTHRSTVNLTVAYRIMSRGRACRGLHVICRTFKWRSLWFVTVLVGVDLGAVRRRSRVLRRSCRVIYGRWHLVHVVSFWPVHTNRLWWAVCVGGWRVISSRYQTLYISIRKTALDFSCPAFKTYAVVCQWREPFAEASLSMPVSSYYPNQSYSDDTSSQGPFDDVASL